MSVYDNPMIFNLYSGVAKVFSAPFGIIPIEERQRVARYNSILSFYIFSEGSGQHYREHFHAFLNGEKVVSIYLDNFEIDYLNSKVKSSDKKKIEEWVRNHIDDLRKIKLDEQRKYDIPHIIESRRAIYMDNNQIIIYQTEDGLTKIDVTLENETVWLNQAQMAELFQTTKQNISYHINNCFKEGELNENSVVKDFLTTAADGKPYNTHYYNLDVIISVGYRVKSLRGTQFRIWANSILKEYLIKGFAMNDDLLKSSGGGDYFKELLDRIRDIRSSERVFYRQILDIYATSVDYDKNAETSILFFKTVQNKMHFAVTKHTAPEIVYLRADSTKPFMGLTNFKGSRPLKSEIGTAKNYLTEQELKELNAITSAYLDFAELQALRRKTMTMRDWVAKLDDFLNMSDSEVLQNAGSISHEMALEKAKTEYDIYRKQTANELSQVEKDFLDSVKKTQKMLESKKQ